jgi:hypothetical protein
MKRSSLARWAAAAAGLGLIAGCQSTNSCSSGCCGSDRPGLLTRLGMRPRTTAPVVVEGGVVEGVPVGGGPVGMPVGGDCPCSNGGGAYPGGPGPFMTVPGGAMPEMQGMPLQGPPIPTAAPGPIFPGPLPNGAAPLVPVPAPPPGLATPTPAPPMAPPTSLRHG